MHNNVSCQYSVAINLLCYAFSIPFVFITAVLTSLRQRLTSIIVIIIIIVIFYLSLYLSDFVDKRGSKVKNTSKEDLDKFYSLSDESEEGTFMFHELHYCALNNRDLCWFIVKCTCLPLAYCISGLNFFTQCGD